MSSSERYAKLPKLMLKSSMPAGAIRLYCFIACHAIKDNKPFLGYDYIIENSTIKDRNTIAKYYKAFDKRFIEVKRRYNDSNVFLVKKPKKRGYEFVEFSFIKDERISDSAFILYAAMLLQWPDDYGVRKISKAKIMEKARIKHRHTFRKALNELKTAEYALFDETKQELFITLFFKNGRIHRGNIPEKFPFIFSQTPFIFSDFPFIFSSAPFIFPYSKKTSEVNSLNRLLNYGTEQHSWTKEKNSNTEQKEEIFAPSGPAAETGDFLPEINRGRYRAGGKFCSQAEWGQALSDYETLDDGMKEKVQEYIEHEIKLFPFHKYPNQNEDAFRKRLKVEYMTDHPIAQHFKSLAPEQKQQELETSKVYQDKLEAERFAAQLMEQSGKSKDEAREEATAQMVEQEKQKEQERIERENEEIDRINEVAAEAQGSNGISSEEAKNIIDSL